MAEVFLNPAFTSISGRIGDVVFFSYGGRTFFRAYVVPRNPDTPAQRSNRDLFRRAMKSWQGLSLFDKNAYNRRARRLGMTGHNLFISRYMIAQSNNSGPGASQGALRADSKDDPDGFSSFQVRGRSVSGSVERSLPYYARKVLGQLEIVHVVERAVAVVGRSGAEVRVRAVQNVLPMPG